MRACSFICGIVVIFLGIDQFYSGLNYWRLFIAGLFAIAVWTDCEPLLKRYYRRKLSTKTEENKKINTEDPCRLPRHLR